MLCKSFSCFLLSCNINALQSILVFVAFTVLLEIAFPAHIFITRGTDNLSFKMIDSKLLYQPRHEFNFFYAKGMRIMSQSTYAYVFCLDYYLYQY